MTGAAPPAPVRAIPGLATTCVAYHGKSKLNASSFSGALEAIEFEDEVPEPAGP